MTIERLTLRTPGLLTRGVDRFAILQRWSANSGRTQGYRGPTSGRIQRLTDIQPTWTTSMLSDACQLCRVCGCEPADAPWGPDGLTPTFEICPSCGVEFGYEDGTLSGIRRYRDQWLEAGGRWSDNSVPDDGLDVSKRLERVPEEYR